MSVAVASLIAAASSVANASSIDEILNQAAQGDTAAMVQAGEHYLARGQSVDGLMYLESVVRVGTPDVHVAQAHSALGIHYERLASSPLAQRTACEHFQRAAVLGHVPSQVRLGKAYLAEAKAATGQERVVLLDQSLVLLEHAAANGDNHAAFFLGESFFAGDGFKRDDQVGSAWWMLAAERGDMRAALALGQRELDAGRAASARKYLTRAAEAGNTDAMLTMAAAFATGDGFELNTTSAREWAVRADIAGAPEAKAMLARLNPAPPPTITTPAVPVNASYSTSTAPAATPDAGAMIAQLQKMIEQQNREIQRLSTIVAPLAGAVEQTTASAPVGDAANMPAAESAEVAAPPRPAGMRPAGTSPVQPGTLDFARSMAPTSRIVIQPAPVPSPDINDNVTVTRHGDQVATVDLTTPVPPVAEAAPAVEVVAAVQAPQLRPARAPKLSLNEQGLQARDSGDADDAVRLFSRAARAGDADAMNNLGYMYMQGAGAPMDRDRAMQLFRQAAEIGHVVAAQNVGYMYQHGIGVRRDLARSSIWYRHAGLMERRQHPNVAVAR